MGVYPEEQVYEAPPMHACDVLDVQFDVSDDLRIVQNQWLYRGRTVRFAVMLYWKGHGDPDLEVSRIDTCHGAVHRHRFKRRTGELGKPDEIRVIPVDSDSWDVVDSEFAKAVDSMLGNAEEYLRKWEK